MAKGNGKKTAKGAGRKKGSGNVVRGPALREKIRVPVNKAAYEEKESELAQLEVQVRRIERKIKPDKDQIRIHKGKISELTNDLSDSTEEAEVLIEREYHYDTNELRFFDAQTGKEVGERRTMTAEERKRQLDVEDKKGGVTGGKAGKALRLANPVLTPGEAAAAARAEDDEHPEA